jgi:outer membrane protein OmpA-like peptidoglycan-associated protein
MHSTRRAAMALLLAPAVLGACVTNGKFKREMTAVRGEIATERTARMSADSALQGDIAALRNDLQTMRTDFDAKITAMEDGLRFALPVNFAYDDATVREQDQASLQRFAQVAQRYYAGSAITVEGFADPAGTARYNLSLSQRRADAVRAFLEAQGLSGAQLKAVGYGESRQVAPGAERDEPGAEQNRRVVFVIETGGEVARMTASVLD